MFNGSAYAPGGQPIEALTASLAVGQFQKNIRVIGDRVCRHQPSGPPVFTDPMPFLTMDMRYERAYGGVDIYSDPAMPCIYPRNHLGKGFVIGKDKKQIEGLALPNIEDPARPVQSPKDRPDPAGFGPLGRMWQTRHAKTGTYTGNYVEARWPWFPEDFDWTHFNAAPEDMQL